MTPTTIAQIAAPPSRERSCGSIAGLALSEVLDRQHLPPLPEVYHWLLSPWGPLPSPFPDGYEPKPRPKPRAALESKNTEE